MSILKQTSWLDKTIGIYVGELIEYDMREGGFSIIKKEKLLPDSVIAEFEKLTKEERHKAVGNLAHSHHRQYKDVPKQLTDWFRYYREEFGRVNNLTDEDIFYIRKDAICVKKYCYETKLNEFIEFREKNVYGCYMRIEPQYIDNGTNTKPVPIEFYWKPDGEVDVKGIRDQFLPPHKNGILLVVSRFMNYLYSMNYDGACRYIVSVMDAYKRGLGDGKNLEHPEIFYRRFDDTAKYRVWKDGAVMEVEELAKEWIPVCDKAYNYRNIFIPMLNLVIK